MNFMISTVYLAAASLKRNNIQPVISSVLIGSMSLVYGIIPQDFQVVLERDEVSSGLLWWIVSSESTFHNREGLR